MQSRTHNTKRNIIASYILMIIQMIFSFVSRTIIVDVLGTEYLGLSSLFTSILQILNIAESGFSSSVVFFMYKPLAEGSTEKVCALLNYLRRVYRAVGAVILCAGLLVTPFITYLVNGDVPADVNIYVLFLLYLANTSIGYFLFAYKTSLLIAIQRLDLTKLANTVVIFIQYALQITALVVFRSYYLFIAAMIVGTAAVNLFTAYICRKKYPEYECRGTVESSIRSDIAKKVRGLLVCNISGVTYNTLDSIIISAYIGLSAVAVYNNYYLIFTTISAFIGALRTSMQASVGNSVACETLDKNYNDLRLWQFLFSMIAEFCSACLICLYQPFMTLWMGEDMLLPFIDVVLLGIWFMESTVQHAFYLYLSTAGLWNEMKWTYIFSTVFNLIMNILLGKLLGITGIILASLAAGTISGLFWQCTIILKKYFSVSSKSYLLKQFLYFAVSGVIITAAYLICSLIQTGGIAGLLIKALICVSVTAGALILIYHRSPYYIRAKQLFLKAVRKD